MEVVEMLDNLKEKARRDLWLLSVRNAGSLVFRFMRWI